MAWSQWRSLPSPFLSLHGAPREAHHRRSSASSPPFSAISAASLRPPRHGGRTAAVSELELALFAFTREPKLSPFHYNSLIRALNRARLPGRALSVFVQMLHDPSSPPDRFTLPFVLKSCAQLGAIEEGAQIHGLLVKIHVVSEEDVGAGSLANALIHMYCQCGRIDLASELFNRMPRRNDVSWNSMIDGFAKCGDIVSARLLFDEMPSRNIVSWNSMISGYVHNGLPDEALSLFLRSQELGIDPDESTMVGVISAISDLGLLGWGKRAHGFITRCGFSIGGALGVSLITMYTRCGSISVAHRVFSDIPNKNVAHWTSIIAGYAAYGFAEDSLQLFSEMLSSGVKPNCITFTSVLNACSHGGLVEEGMKVFDLMRTYGIGPHQQHYGCLVDLLSRSGLVEEALELIGCLPGEPGPVVWGTLLAACRNHGNIVIAETIAHKLMELEPDYGGSYVLLSKLYADLGRWGDFSWTRKMMEENGVEKTPGFSWIEVDGDIHKFVMGDKFHPKHREMYNVLGGMEHHLSWAGCRFSFRDSEQ
ncbi:hypothetical protein Taro_041004 [Colocasia esculenta]|uniref:Pentatricopeptide repeat-containing protein n=1 Tax=Colocasia esculenta TaxID=4460 RepID=A0A843WW45_COLES|nr:hypothetical protein [Colocasia esculenta]